MGSGGYLFFVASFIICKQPQFFVVTRKFCVRCHWHMIPTNLLRRDDKQRTKDTSSVRSKSGGLVSIDL